MDYSKIELIISDHSGVISDDKRPVYEANRRILKRYGMPCPKYQEFFRTTKRDIVEFLDEHGINLEKEEIMKMYEDYYHQANQDGFNPSIYPGVVNCIRYLRKKGIKIAIVSSHPSSAVVKELESYNISNHIYPVIASSWNKAVGLERAISLNKKNKDKVVYVGDTIFDLMFAREVGISFVGVTSGYHSKEMLEKENPDDLLETFFELKRKF